MAELKERKEEAQGVVQVLRMCLARDHNRRVGIRVPS